MSAAPPLVRPGTDGFVPLHGPRLAVRPFTVDDIQPAYVGWLNDPAVVRFSNQRFRQHTMESSRAYVGSFAGTPNLFLAMVEREGGAMVGTLTVYRNLHHETADIGIMVGAPASWGRGYGLEAFSLVLQWLLGRPDVRKVTAGTLAANVGMVRIMERAGMDLEAVRKGQELLDGQPVDVVYHARFRNA